MKERTQLIATGLVTLGAAAGILPFAWLFVTSIRSPHDLLANPYGWPSHLTLSNFRELFEIPGVTRTFLNSMWIATASALLTFGAALCPAYLLARFEFPGKRFLGVVAVSGYLFAPAVLAPSYFSYLVGIGITGTAGIIWAHCAFSLPLAVSLVDVAVIRSVPISLEEVAASHGLGVIGRIWTVILPATRFQSLAILSILFCVSWKEFLFAFLLGNSPETRTLPVLLAALTGGEAFNWHIVCALGVLLIAPAGAVFFWVRRIPAVSLPAEGTRG